MPRGRPIPDDIKAQAVAAVRQHGLAEAVRQTGHPKNTIRDWCLKAGLDLTGRTSEINRRAAEDSAARRRTLIAEADERAVTLLTAIRDRALQETVKRLGAGAMDDRSIIGAWTRATHDLNLLTGQATERAEQQALNVEVQVTVRNELVERLNAMARRMTIDLPPPDGNGSSNGHHHEENGDA